MLDQHETSSGYPIEAIISLGGEYLEKIRDNFPRLMDVFTSNSSDPMVLEIIKQIRLDFLAFQYWTNTHLSDQRVAALNDEVSRIINQLLPIEAAVGFDFNVYVTAEANKDNKAFAQTLTNEDQIEYADPEYENHLLTIVAQLKTLLSGLKRAKRLNMHETVPLLNSHFKNLVSKLEDAAFRFSSSEIPNSFKMLQAINAILDGSIVAEIAVLLNELKSPGVKESPVHDKDTFPPQPATDLLNSVTKFDALKNRIELQTASYTAERLRADAAMLQAAKNYIFQVDESINQLQSLMEDVKLEIETYESVSAPNVDLQRSYVLKARELRQNYLQNVRVTKLVSELKAFRSKLAQIVFVAENPNIDRDADIALKDLLGKSEKDLTQLNDAKLATLVEDLVKKLADAKQKLHTQSDPAIEKELQSLIQDLERILSIASKIQQDRAHSRHETLEKSAATLAVEFFDGGHIPDFLPNYRNREWLKESPTKLAAALFFYVERVIMEAQTSGNDAFIPMNIFGWHLTFTDHTLSQLIESFGSLGLLYPEQPEKLNQFKELNGKLAIDFARIEQIHKLGTGVNQLEQAPDQLLDFLIEKGNRIEHELMRKIARIGYDYQDKEGQLAHGGKLFYAQQAWLFLHDPVMTPLAVYEDTPDEAPVFVRHAAVKSEFSVFPVGLELELHANPGTDYLIKRMAVRMVAGSLKKDQRPPWTYDPRWGRQIINGKPESLPDLAARRQLIGRQFMEKLLYSYQGGPTRDANNKLKTHPKSLYARLENKIDEKTTDAAFLPTDNELKVIKEGFFAELQAACLMEYYLMSAKAEGVKSVPGSTRFGYVPELAAKGGPTAKHYVARIVSSVVGYSRKLTSDEGGGEGSHIPLNIRDKFNRILLTFLDRYFFPPTGSEDIGVSLREQMYLCDTADQYVRLPFQAAITMGEKNVAWVDQLDMAKLLMQVLFKGMNVNWHSVVAMEPGSEGTVVTFSPVIAEKIKSTLSRNAYYLLTRDWGRQVGKWKTTAEYNQFKELESIYLQQKQQGRPNVKPARIGSRVISDKEWQKVIDWNRLPTARHRIVDGRNLSDKSLDEVVRVVTNIDEFITIPAKERDMNRFEKAVLLNPNVDELTKLQILLVGTIFMGDVYRSESAHSMAQDDLTAFRKLFSRQYWNKFEHNPMGKFISRVWAGRKVEEKYNGIGYFLPEMVEEMLAEAGVGTGPAVFARDLLQKVQKFGA